MEKFTDISSDSAANRYIKVGSVLVTFAISDGEIQTLEGRVQYSTEDAILTGVQGESWPVGRAHFDSMYESDGDFAHGCDGKYRKKTSAYVFAKQMSETFTVSVGQGDVLTGKAGDWLVQYQGGQQGIVANEIFRKTYQRI